MELTEQDTFKILKSKYHIRYVVGKNRIEQCTLIEEPASKKMKIMEDNSVDDMEQNKEKQD